MKVTVQIPDGISDDLKAQAKAERKSVSELVAHCITYYIGERKKKSALKGFVKMAGKTHVDGDTLETLERWRADNDRT
ncbi:MAG: hypothetical protein LBQ00_00105 [Syntrophobacterales bacterium]|jgi:hypothetical protein|nr:hypothetical protein [Syntrophobacterales bacterium]